MRYLILDCSTGASGDMIVGALLDLGIDKIWFKKELNKLNITGFDIKISKVNKHGKSVNDYQVIRNHNLSQADQKRNLYDVIKIIEESAISDNAKKIAKDIFKIAAIGGSQAHRTTVDKFFFHEPGAVDSIADIVGAAICIDNLQMDYIISTPLTDGTGYIQVKNRQMSIPVPAVKNIVRNHQLSYQQLDVEGELVTPTGAAIIAALQEDKKLPKNVVKKKIGYGNGKRKYTSKSILKAVLYETKNGAKDERHCNC